MRARWFGFFVACSTPARGSYESESAGDDSAYDGETYGNFDCTTYFDYTSADDYPGTLKFSKEHMHPHRPTDWFMPQNVSTPCVGTLYNCPHPHRELWTKRRQCSVLRGHLEPLGQQSDAKCARRETNFEPRNFVEKYLRKQRPVVLHGISKLWAATVKWGNNTAVESDPAYLGGMRTAGDEYLGTKCGHEEHIPWYTNIEVEKKVKRSDRGPFMREWDFCEFVRQYRTLEWKDKLYVASQPIENFNLRSDIPVPEVIRCPEVYDTWQDIILWMNSGGGVSHLHFDTDENVMFQVSGHKHTVLVDPMYSLHLYMDYHNKYGLSPLDVDAVDMHRFPRAAEAPILEASTFPGDAIYIPDSWWHTVHSHGGEADRNIAVGVHWQMFVGNQEFPLSEVCSRTIKNVWSTGAILSHSKRLNHSWPGPVNETCRTLRKRQLTHEIRILQDQANFHIDGEGTMRGAENDPSLDDLA